MEFLGLRRVWVPLSLPLSLRGGIRRFRENEKHIFYCADGILWEVAGVFLGRWPQRHRTLAYAFGVLSLSGLSKQRAPDAQP